MKNRKEYKNYMSKQKFISEFAKRTQMSEEKANQIVTAILEILDKCQQNNELVCFDSFQIQLIKDFPED